MSLNQELDRLNGELENVESEIKKVGAPFQERLDKICGEKNAIRDKYDAMCLKEIKPLEAKIDQLFSEQDMLTKDLRKKARDIQSEIIYIYDSMDIKTKKLGDLT